MRGLFDKITKIVIGFGCIALVVLVGLTSYQVWGRYVMNASPTWAERLALLLTLVIALPVGAVGIREKFHISVTAFTDILPSRWQVVAEWFTLVVLWVFAVFMAIYSAQFAVLTWNRLIPLLGITQAMQYIPLTICGVLMTLFLTEAMIDKFHGRNNFDHKVEEERL